MPEAEELFSSAKPQSAGSEPQSRVSGAATGALVLRITPMGAFAAGALVVSALALAVAVGRRHPLSDGSLSNGRNAPGEFQVSIESLEDVRNSIPVEYETLQVDRGTAK